ncbi:MAG: hypothetical protein ACRD0K_06925 [Egibacteraceae bacterium]
MSTTSFRLDPESEAALRYLEALGMGRSEAIRRGVVEFAQRHRRAALLAEVSEIAADPQDRAEKAAIMRLMEELAPDESAE